MIFDQKEWSCNILISRHTFYLLLEIHVYKVYIQRIIPKQVEVIHNTLNKFLNNMQTVMYNYPSAYILLYKTKLKG